MGYPRRAPFAHRIDSRSGARVSLLRVVSICNEEGEKRKKEGKTIRCANAIFSASLSSERYGVLKRSLPGFRSCVQPVRGEKVLEKESAQHLSALLRGLRREPGTQQPTSMASKAVSECKGGVQSGGTTRKGKEC